MAKFNLNKAKEDAKKITKILSLAIIEWLSLKSLK